MSFDWDRVIEDVDQELENTQTEESEETEETEEVREVEEVEDVQESEEIQEEEEVANSLEDEESFIETSKPKQTPEENKKFAEIRHKLKEAETYKEVIEKIATTQGLTGEQLLKAYQEQQEVKEAEEKGIPVDVYRRLNELEQYKKQSEVDLMQERYIHKVNELKTKHNLDDEDPKMKKTWEYIRSKGYYNPQTLVPYIDFEDAFRIVNFEEMQKESAKKAKQAQLAAKKQRQTQANPVYQGGQASTADSGETDISAMSSEEFRRYARKIGYTF